jgi:hypothetical protein
MARFYKILITILLSIAIISVINIFSFLLFLGEGGGYLNNPLYKTEKAPGNLRV